jgi:hypothetical protein
MGTPRYSGLSAELMFGNSQSGKIFPTASRALRRGDQKLSGYSQLNQNARGSKFCVTQLPKGAEMDSV